MNVSRQPPISALDAAHPYAVSLWDVSGSWPTDRQALALDAALGADSVNVADLERLLSVAETAALDVAAIGFVLGICAHGRVNRFRYNGMPTPSVKNEAGCPHGFWLPPIHLGEEAEGLMRERTDRPLDAESVVAWARVQIRAWWEIAAMFAPRAAVCAIDETGLPDVEGASDHRVQPSDHPLGDIWPLDHEQVAKVKRCQATYTHLVTSPGPDFHEVVGIGIVRQCVLPATKTGKCQIHDRAC